MARSTALHTFACRTSAIASLLLLVGLSACSGGWNPLDPGNPLDGQPPVGQPPAGPAPEGPGPGGPAPPESPAQDEPAHPTGGLEVTVTGHDLVALRGYRVVIQVEGEIEPRTRFAVGPTVRILGLPQGAHSVRLEPLATHCAPVDAGDRAFSIVAGETSPMEFTVTCAPVFGWLAGSYERRVEIGRTPGFLSERYVLQADGTFRLRYETSATHSFEYPGVYYQSEDGSGNTSLVLLFFGNPGQWSAVATHRGGCLEVEYNLDMWLSDFEPGDYCR